MRDLMQVTVGTIVSNVTLPYPVGASKLIRIHSSTDHLLAIFDTGLVYSVDSTHGTVRVPLSQT
jgi:hypothetical protein